jgi:predicted permease
MTEVANILLPVFAVIALGAALRHSRFASPQLFRETNRLAYWVALPALLFYKTAESQPPGGAAARIFAVLCGGMLLTVAAGYLVAAILRLPPPGTSAFVQGGFRSNLAYVGLPIVLLAMAAQGGNEVARLQALGVISTALLMPAYNVVGVLVLLAGRAGGRAELPRRLGELLLRLITNPLTLSCAAGLVVMALGWKLPPPLRETLVIVGDMASPLALLGIGAAMSFATFRLHARNASIAAMIKTVVSPLLGLLIAGLLSMTRQEVTMSLIFLACPTAAASYVMAQQLGADEGLAANIIMVSTVLAAPALAVVIALG